MDSNAAPAKSTEDIDQFTASPALDAMGRVAAVELCKIASSYFCNCSEEFFVDGWADILNLETPESVAEVVGGIIPEVIDLRTDLLDYLGEDEEDGCNPWFINNGISITGKSTQTEWYFKKRRWIRRAQMTAGALGKVTGWFGGWNAYDITGTCGSVVGATHSLGKLTALSSRLPKGGTLALKLQHVIKLKMLKSTSYYIQLAADSIPYVGQFVPMLAGIGKAGMMVRWEKATIATAAALHWQAFQEMSIAGSSGGRGPCCKIIDALFADCTPVGAVILESTADIQRIIQEPHGWLVISDKLNNV